MEPQEYTATWLLEDRYWWFRGLRVFLDDLLGAEGRGAQRVLDVGCGAGKNAEWLSARRAEVTAVDASPHGLALARRRGLSRLVRADANRLPLASSTFDLVVSVDLLESEGVRQADAVGEMARVVRPGGLVLLWAAAFSWLASEHDRAVHSTQRVSLGQLEGLARGAGLRVERATYLYRLLFPALAARKLLSRVLGEAGRLRSDLRALPRPVDEVLFRICGLESRLLGDRLPRLPGTSAVVVARKSA